MVIKTTIQYAQKQSILGYKNGLKLTKIVHIAQISADEIRISFGERKYMRTIYIADDGKEFDNEFECEDYEWMLNHPHLNDIKCYDKDGNLFDDIMADDTYNYCQMIVVPTDECARELSDLADYTGYCYYAHITEAGTWIFKENGTDGRFVKVGD